MKIKPHDHGISCCWDCFHGNKAHPKGESDYDCEYEIAEFGKAAVFCLILEVGRVEDASSDT